MNNGHEAQRAKKLENIRRFSELVMAGKSVSLAARKLGLHHSCGIRYRQHLEASNPPPDLAYALRNPKIERSKDKTALRREANIARFAELILAGNSVVSATKILGLCSQVGRNYRRTLEAGDISPELAAALRNPEHMRGADHRRAMAERRKTLAVEIRAQFAAGCNLSTAARNTGVSRRHIHTVCKEFGIALPAIPPVRKVYPIKPKPAPELIDLEGLTRKRAIYKSAHNPRGCGKTTKRRCLGMDCGREFDSWGPGNRMCEVCR